LLGQAMTGAVVSRTVTLKLQLLVLPVSSVAVQRTVVMPKLNRLPDGCAQATVTLVSQWSEAMTLKETMLPAALVHSMI
jgi:hypothetical protein